MSKRALWITLLIIVGVMSLAVAQDSGSLTYGSVVLGNVSTQDAQVRYSFNGTVGDVVTIRVNSASTGMDPNVTLLSPTGETIGINDNTLLDFSNNAVIFSRLFATGTYTIVVSGSPGDFLVTLDANTAPAVTVLELDSPLNLTLPLVDQAQTFAFNTDPLNATTLLVDANGLDVDAYLEIVDANGERVASLRGDLDNACFSFSPGDELNEVRFAVSPTVAGSFTLTLGRNPCAFASAPQVIQPQPTGTFQITPINGACTIGSRNNFNVRTGPGLMYPILRVWAARQPLQVVGRSQDGQWYTVQVMGVQAWVSASVVVNVGPCDQLAVIPAPPVPTLAATIIPTQTLTPTMTTTATIQATVETPAATATTEPTVAITPTIATVEPTIEPTIPPIEVITPEMTPTPA